MPVDVPRPRSVLVAFLLPLLLAACGDRTSGSPPVEMPPAAEAPADTPDAETPPPADALPATPKARAQRIAELVEALVSGRTRDAHVVATAELPRFGAEAVPALVAALERPGVGPGGGAWIAEVLASIGPAGAPAAPALAQRLARGGRFVPVTAWALQRIGEPSVPFLAEALTSEHTETRVYAANALVALGTHAALAADRLIDVLGDTDAVARTYAARALGVLPRVKARSVPGLLDLSRDDDASARHAAGEALVRLAGDDPAVQRRLMDMVLYDDDDYTRTTVLRGLDGHLAKGAATFAFLRGVLALPDAEPRLVTLARDMLLARGVDDPVLVAAAAEAPPGETFEALLRRGRILTQSGAHGRRASLPLLVRVLDWGPDLQLRVEAATLLGALGRLAAADGPTMEALAVHADERNEKPPVVAAARAALKRLRL